MPQELFRPSGSASAHPMRGEGRAQFRELAGEHEIDRIAGKAVAGEGEARDALALQDLETHPHDPRQDHIGGDCVGEGQRENCRKSVIGDLKDERDQPDGKDSKTENKQTSNETNQKPQVGAFPCPRSG